MFSAPLLLFVAGATFASADPSPSCPEGWTFFFKAKKCYKHFPVIKDFDGARSLCQENGGDIAIATELGENNFVSFTFTDQKLWLGGQRIGSTNDFQWTYRGAVVSDTSKFVPQQFLPWLPNQPSNSGGSENCIMTNWDNEAKWNDISCSRGDLAQVVCEKPQDSLIEPSTNYLVGTIQSWGPSFSVSFDLKINSWPTASWASLLHFSDSPSRHCCEIGQRIPAFYLSNNKGFLVVSNIGSNGNRGRTLPIVWELGEWFRIDVQQYSEATKVFFVIRVNGVPLYKVENQTPRTFTDVKVYSALTDTADWSGPAADAVIRDLQYQSPFSKF